MMAEAGPRPHLPVSPGVGPIQGCGKIVGDQGAQEGMWLQQVS